MVEFERVDSEVVARRRVSRRWGLLSGLPVKGWKHGGVIGRMEAVFLQEREKMSIIGFGFVGFGYWVFSNGL